MYLGLLCKLPGRMEAMRGKMVSGGCEMKEIM